MGSNGRCTCTSDNQILVESGSGYSCESCDGIYWRGPREIPSFECRKCPGAGRMYEDSGNDVAWECNECEDEYELAGDVCYLEDDVDEIGSINTVYRPESSESSFDSATFKHLGLKAVAGCVLEKNPQQC